MRSAVVFPHPDGPDEDDELAGGDLEVELGDGFGPVGIHLRQLLENDLRHVGLQRRI